MYQHIRKSKTFNSIYQAKRCRDSLTKLKHKHNQQRSAFGKHANGNNINLSYRIPLCKC